MKLAVATLFLLSIDTLAAFTVQLQSSRLATHCNVKVDGRPVEGEVQPTNNFVLVKTTDAIDHTEGGVLLTDSQKVVKTEGKVISVGPGKIHHETGALFEMPVSPGDGVVYGKYDGTELDIDGVKHTLIRDDDILVKFSGDSLTYDSVEVVRDAVLVRVDKDPTATEGGILLAISDNKSKPPTGKVVKVGPGKFANSGETVEMHVVPGDSVKYRDYAGNEIEVEGEEYTVVKMMDILAKY